jgi:glycosyltransferase involved in cell wall biosynthesis
MDKNLNKPNNPEITVLMSVFNGQKYLKEAIDSILSQTFRDFEFLIVNDGSNDLSEEIIKSYNDPRIKYVSNDVNRGLPFSLNRGIELAKGEFIARMDCDDESLPERLEKQLAFMEDNPEVVACGTWIKSIGDSTGYVNKFLSDPDEIKANLLFNTSLAHPSVIMRKSTLLESGLRYNAEHLHFEDYALWVELSKVGKLSNIPEALLLYRLHGESVSHQHGHEQKSGASKIRQRQLEAIGMQPSTEDMRIHNSLHPKKDETIDEFIDNEEKWLAKIINANSRTKTYDEMALSRIIYTRWLTICGINSNAGLKIWRKFQSSKLIVNSHGDKLANINQSARLFFKCLLRRK